MKYLILMCLFAVSSCSSPKSFNNGTYGNPREINLLNDKFSESDAQTISGKVYSQVKECMIARNLKRIPTLAVNRISNQTSEMVEMNLIVNSLSHNLYDSGSFRFVDKKSRMDLADEYEYENSGFVSKGSRKALGNQRSVDYFLNGVLSSNEQVVGKIKTIYYQMSVELLNVETNTVDCQAFVEIKKSYEKNNSY